MSSENWRLREATVGDLDIIVHHRRSMFADMRDGDQASREVMATASRPFIEAGLRDGSYRGWLAEIGSRVVAGGGLAIVPFQPIPLDPAPRRVWVVNMYTEPEFRHQGLARAVLKAIIGWCRSQGIPRVSLHASDDGRSLYESLGFRATNEMRLDLA